MTCKNIKNVCKGHPKVHISNLNSPCQLAYPTDGYCICLHL